MKGFFKLISSAEFTDLFADFVPLATEQILTGAARGRVIAEDILAKEDLPPFSRSTMDGYAVRAKDTFGCSESEPALLNIVGEIAMGTSGQDYSLRASKTARIWTGGELPQKGDSVVMVEYTNQLDEETIEVFRPVAPSENIIRAGEDFSVDSLVLPKGKKLRPQDLGVLSGLGITGLAAYRKPRVAILSTGDELVPPEKPLAPGKIRDINSTTLAALVEEAGAIATQYGIIEDNLETMLAACTDALKDADMILLSGGSSVGRRDFTLQVLEQIENSQVLAHGVAIRPGKPTILAQQGNKALFGLPGHAASAMVVFYLFVRPLLRKYSGLGANIGLPKIQAMTNQQVPSTIGREEFVRVRLEQQPDGQPPLATPVYGKSGLLSPLIQADGLLIIDRDTEGLDQGAMAQTYLFPST